MDHQAFSLAVDSGLFGYVTSPFWGIIRKIGMEEREVSPSVEPRSLPTRSLALVRAPAAFYLSSNFDPFICVLSPGAERP